jgi:CheY-like chemotaxis protein
MDLAMPVMDGWEASYIIRKIHQSDTIIGIVSANAYDKRLDNAAGIDSSDFIVKPVRVEELLGWIGRRLALEWVSNDAEVEESLGEILDGAIFDDAIVDSAIVNQNFNAIAATDIHFPPQESINELLTMIDIGYIKGINKKLDVIAAADEKHLVFVEQMRALSSQFEIDKMKVFLKEMTV